MFDWLEPITWEKAWFFLSVNETEVLGIWLQITETTESKLEHPNEQIFSLLKEMLRILFLIKKNKLQDSFDNSNGNLKPSCLDALTWSSISKAAFLRMANCRKPRFAVASPSCRSVRKYFLEKLLQILVLYSTPTCNWRHQLYIYFFKTPKNTKNSKINPLTGASLGIPGLPEHHCSHHTPTPSN